MLKYTVAVVLELPIAEMSAVVAVADMAVVPSFLEYSFRMIFAQLLDPI